MFFYGTSSYTQYKENEKIMFTPTEINEAVKIDGIDKKVVPFNHTHLKVMDFRSHDIQIIESFVNYDELTKNLNGNGLSFTGIANKKFVCCFGLVKIWDGNYECWLLPSSDVGKNKFAFHRAALRFFTYAAKKLKIHRMQMIVLISNDIAYKWAQKCYFIQEGLLRKYGPDKSDYFMMSRIFNTNDKE